MKLLIPPPIQAIIFAGLIWVVAIYFPELVVDVPFKRVISALFFLAGVTIDLLALRGFYRNQTTVNPLSPQKTTFLVADGIYRYSRNPMYLGLALLLISLTIWFGAILGLVVVSVFCCSITYLQILPEEKILLEKFGGDYIAYCRNVRRWI